MLHSEIFKCVGDAQGGEPWISSDGDDHRDFFYGKIWQVFSWVT